MENPLLDAVLNFMQIRRYKQAEQEREEDRRRAAEAYQVSMEDRRRRQQTEDLRSILDIRNQGGTPVNPSFDAALDAEFGPPTEPRPTVQDLRGQSYYLPKETPYDVEQKQARDAQLVNELKLKQQLDVGGALTEPTMGALTGAFGPSVAGRYERQETPVGPRYLPGQAVRKGEAREAAAAEMNEYEQKKRIDAANREPQQPRYTIRRNSRGQDVRVDIDNPSEQVVIGNAWTGRGRGSSSGSSYGPVGPGGVTEGSAIGNAPPHVVAAKDRVQDMIDYVKDLASGINAKGKRAENQKERDDWLQQAKEIEKRMIAEGNELQARFPQFIRFGPGGGGWHFIELKIRRAGDRVFAGTGKKRRQVELVSQNDDGTWNVRAVK